jgi:hypothetical protein
MTTAARNNWTEEIYIDNKIMDGHGDLSPEACKGIKCEPMKACARQATVAPHALTLGLTTL